MATDLPTSMRAQLFTSTSGGLEKNLSISSSAPLPIAARALSKDQVLVKVFAAALNPVDYKFPEIPVVGRLVVGRPSSPGLDFAGKVVSTGTDDLKVGQLVFGRLDGPTRFGTLGEYIVAPKLGTVALPEGVTAQDAACVGCAGATAYQSIVPRVKKGDRVFINGGSGGTGVWGIQIAKLLGCEVVASCSTANVQLCKDLGADEVLDYKKVDVVEGLKALGKDKGKLFDLVVDNVGTPKGLYWKAHEFMNPDGKFVQVGATIAFGAVLELLNRMLWPKFLGGGQRSFEFVEVKSNREDLSQIGVWLQQGKLKAVKDQVFAHEEATKAFEKLKTGRAKGKIVVEVAREQ